jgi:hypothetical protein
VGTNDRIAMTLRTVLLIVPLAIVANLWRFPSGPVRYLLVLAVCACLVARERISYRWWRS